MPLILAITTQQLVSRQFPDSSPRPSLLPHLQDISDANYTLNLFGLDLAAQFQVGR